MLSNGIFRMLIAVFDNSSNITDMLQKSPSSSFPEAWALVIDIYNKVALPLGIMMIVIYFIINIQVSSIEGIDQGLRSWIKPLISVFVGIALMTYGMDIFITLFELGHTMINVLVENIGTVGSVTMEAKLDAMNALAGTTLVGLEEGVFVQVGKIGMVDGIGLGIELLIPYVVSLIINIAVTFIFYGRLINMFIRFAVAPIALSDVAAKGQQSTGFRYIKSFLALALQGFLMIAVVVIYEFIQVSIFEAGILSIGGLVSYLGLAVAYLSLLAQTGTISKELVGVA